MAAGPYVPAYCVGTAAPGAGPNFLFGTPGCQLPNSLLAGFLVGAGVRRPAAGSPTSAAPAAPALTPQVLAEQFSRTIPLPTPKPTVPPGWAITGMRAYLVTNGSVDPPSFSEQTPLGRLTVQAKGKYLVNWGDSHDPGWAGPYGSEGEPYPNGQITHTYDWVGSYTITVEETWTATWTLGGATGTLGGLRTEATIPGLQARQLEAVNTN